MHLLQEGKLLKVNKVRLDVKFGVNHFYYNAYLFVRHRLTILQLRKENERGLKVWLKSETDTTSPSVK